ncbi:MAG: NAD(P)-binding domain-containing protein [Bacillota bacterium]
MEVFLENILTYGLVAILSSAIIILFIKTSKKKTNSTGEKITEAKELGFHEPVSLHPVVNHEMCIGSGACILACPEKDILGISNGQAVVINASRCVGHGACFQACPVNAISLHMGTEKRGVGLPHLNEKYETNLPGLFIAGELGGMGLIKNAVEQGKQAIENISKNIKRNSTANYDVVIIGAGPAGISASLSAAKNKLRFITIEQDSLGGTVFNFPRSKIVMTSPMDLPLYGKVKLSQTSKDKLLELWKDVLKENNIKINEMEKVTCVEKRESIFETITEKGRYTSDFVLLAIGRRGSPKKLGVPGEGKQKVAYRLLEPELITDKHILIIGGGDSAVEAACSLIGRNNIITVSYRGNSFNRIKPLNLERILKAHSNNDLKILYKSEVSEISEETVILKLDGEEKVSLKNDLVYIFAGGELPSQFLEKIGVKITKKYGEAILK